MSNLKQLYKTIDNEVIEQEIAIIENNLAQYGTTEVLKKLYGSIDLTTLNTDDTAARVEDMCKKVSEFHTYARFVGIPNVAAVCVFPNFVANAKKMLTARGTKIAAVAGGFPASQTFLEIKVAEIKKAVENGASEIDVVLPVGKFKSGDFDGVFEELRSMKQACGKAHLKVILETGLLKEAADIHFASLIAMKAGADFVKTSTGKLTPAATPFATYVMAMAVKEYFEKTGKMVGIKPAGGISVAQQAVVYYAIMDTVLGAAWLNPSYFRIGASKLANNILSHLITIQTTKQTEIEYHS